MSFGIIGRTGPMMRQVVGFGDRSTGRGTFGGEFGARHCNQSGLAFAATQPSFQITLGRLVLKEGPRVDGGTFKYDWCEQLTRRRAHHHSAFCTSVIAWFRSRSPSTLTGDYWSNERRHGPRAIQLRAAARKRWPSVIRPPPLATRPLPTPSVSSWSLSWQQQRSAR